MLSEKCFVPFFDEVIKRDGVFILIVNVRSSLFVCNVKDMIRNLTVIHDKSVITCVVFNKCTVKKENELKKIKSISSQRPQLFVDR